MVENSIIREKKERYLWFYYCWEEEEVRGISLVYMGIGFTLHLTPMGFLFCLCALSFTSFPKLQWDSFAVYDAGERERVAFPHSVVFPNN